MGVDIRIKRQTKELKDAYLSMEKSFGDRSYFMSEGHPLYSIYRAIRRKMDKSPFIGEEPLLIINGRRWSNLSIQVPDYIPYVDNKDILNFTICQEVLFTEEIEKIVESFDKIYLRLYPGDKYVIQFSQQLHCLVDNNLMLIPG